MDCKKQINLRLKTPTEQSSYLNIHTRNNLALVSEVQIQHREAQDLLSSSFKSDQRIFEFDNIFDGQAQQLEVFKVAVEPLVQKAISEFKNACIILLGPTGAGKSFTLRGGEWVQRGVILRSVDAMINFCQTYNYILKASGVSISFTGVIDLLTGLKLSTAEDPKDMQIENINQMYQFLRQTLKFRDKKTKNKVHYGIQFNICKNSAQQSSLCRIDFIELAGIEILQGQGAISIEEKAFVQQSFNILSQCICSSPVYTNKSLLTRYMYPVLSNNISIICCVSNDQDDYRHNYNVIKFASELRDTSGENEASFLIQELNNLKYQIQNYTIPSDENALNV